MTITKYPYEVNDGQTHFEGCEYHRGHHNCALVKLEDAIRERDELVGAIQLALSTEDSTQADDILQGVLRGG